MLVKSINYLNKSECRLIFENGEFLDLPIDLIYKYSINKNVILTQETINLIKQDLESIELRKKILNFLQFKRRTEKEVLTKLKQLTNNILLIEKTISFLKEFNYLNDEEYAKMFINDNLKIKKKSINRIKQELSIKGINYNLIEDLIDDSNDLELTNCKDIAEKKLKTIKTNDKKQQKQKLFNYLLTKGFNSDTIKRVLNELLILLILVVLSNSIILSNDSCKIRLDDRINSYQPAIIPVITIDGKYLFFDRKLHPENTNGLKDEDDIWFSKSENNTWSEPINLNTLNTIKSDVLFTITPDGSKALVWSSKQIKDGIYDESYYMIDNLNLNDLNNINLKKIKIQNYRNESKNFYASLSYDAKIIILSINNSSSNGDLDLFVSFYDSLKGFWTTPKNLGTKINSKFSEGSPYLSYDKKTLFFTSNKDGGFGYNDVYMSRRLDDTWLNWSEPKNLGKTFNSFFDESSLWINALGDTALVVSNDTINKRMGIYKICIPDEYRPDDYHLLKVTVSNFENDKTLEVKIKEERNEYSFISRMNYFYIVVQKNSKINASIFQEGYEQYNLNFDWIKLDKPTIFDKEIFLKKNPKNIVIERNLKLNIFFDFASFIENNENYQELINNLLKLDKNKNYHIRIYGFTDSVGNKISNIELAKKRINRIKSIIDNILTHTKYDLNPIGIDYENLNNPTFSRRVYLEIIEK